MSNVSLVDSELINDRYQPLDVIASGGMATVWRARDTRLDRIVAVKRPHPAPPDDPGTLRIEREARIAASVSHPNLVTVFDSGRDEIGPYMVMELVEGQLLNAAAADMERSDVVVIAAEVADALAAIHEAGIVHRDVKPSNVMMSERGPLLTDFGIARVRGGDDRITRTGDVVATPSYAAPEVLSGSEPTPAADVYSFALMVYELVTGHLAFPDADRSAPPPPLADPHLEATLRPALSTDPTARPTAGDLAAALRGSAPTQILDGAAVAGATTAVMETVPSPAANAEGGPRPNSGTRRLAGVFGLAGVALAVLVLAVLTNDVDGEAGVPSQTQAVPPVSPPTTTVTSPTTTVTPPTTTVTSPTTTVTIDPVMESRDRFIAVLEDAHPSDLRPKDRRQLIEKVDEVIAKARDDREDNARKQLESLAETVDDELDDDLADRALKALSDLADSLGIALEEGED